MLLPLRLPFESRWRLKKQLLYFSFKQQNKIMSFLSVCIGWLCSSCSSWLVVWGGRCFASLPDSLSLKPIVGWLRTAHKQVNILPQMFTPCLCLNSHPSIFIALLAASSLHCLVFLLCLSLPSIPMLGLWRPSCRAQQWSSVISALVAEWSIFPAWCNTLCIGQLNWVDPPVPTHSPAQPSSASVLLVSFYTRCFQRNYLSLLQFLHFLMNEKSLLVLN